MAMVVSDGKRFYRSVSDLLLTRGGFDTLQVTLRRSSLCDVCCSQGFFMSGTDSSHTKFKKFPKGENSSHSNRSTARETTTNQLIDPSRSCSSFVREYQWDCFCPLDPLADILLASR
jgi:hypothetical protein